MKALSISNLKKEYQGGVQALKGIDLQVEQGDFFALLGPNGAGKSTTIGVISSLVTKTSGSVKILGIDIDENHSLAKKKLGVVGQEVNFNQFEKVGDIIRNQAGYYGLGFRKSKENAKYYMKKLDIWDKRNEQARKLSGGMKRRVMVAKALVNNPELLILDEPTAGVDIELRRSLWDFLTEINDNGTSIILTTHYLEEAERLCRNIAIIDSGEIVENTSMQELLTRLEVETFIFDLLEPIKELPEVKEFEIIIENPKRIKVTVGKEQGLSTVFKKFTELNIEISSMRNETGRLEELFLGLVEPSLKEKEL
jgi:ABC-2 type transport system ATP-binding protein|tara:strand:+ start:437 stop:1366 length:930 start_codon:yes stop_codon:yes gene_type:complete